jgi:hypothetical protein
VSCYLQNTEPLLIKALHSACSDNIDNPDSFRSVVTRSLASRGDVASLFIVAMQALADSPLIIPPNLIADNTDSKEKEKDLQPSASGSGINALKSIRTLRSFHADNKSHLLVRSLDTLKDTKLKTLVYLFASFLAPFIVVFDRTDDASQHTLLLAHQQLKDFIQQNASNLDNVSRCS